MLTLKQMGLRIQNLIQVSNIVHYKCDIFVYNWSNTIET